MKSKNGGLLLKNQFNPELQREKEYWRAVDEHGRHYWPSVMASLSCQFKDIYNHLGMTVGDYLQWEFLPCSQWVAPSSDLYPGMYKNERVR